MKKHKKKRDWQGGLSFAKQSKKRHLLDYSIFIPYLILSIVGLIMVYSSTSITSNERFFTYLIRY